jgi:L-fuconolactonase
MIGKYPLMLNLHNIWIFILFYHVMKPLRIDSHQHFWNYDPIKHIWMNDDMGVLKTNYSPTDLEPLLKNCDLDGCVAVQANQAEIENEFLLDLAKKNDFIKGIVGWVDLRAENVEERLQYYQKFPKIKGFRHVIHDESELDFILRPAFMRGVSKLNQFNYTYDILIFSEHLPNTLELVKTFPDQSFVIDHIAKPSIKNGEIDHWRKNLQKVAKYKNVCCKISGMVTEADWKNWKKEDFTKYLDTVVEAFGINRIMYGSDWPVCLLSASYTEQFRIVKGYFSSFSQTEQELIFGENATNFYHL